MAERNPPAARGAEPPVPHHQPAAAIREPGGEHGADEPAGHQGDPGGRRGDGRNWRRFTQACSGRSNTARTPRMSSRTRSITRWPAASGISGSSPNMRTTTRSIRKSSSSAFSIPLSVFWAPGSVEPDRSDAEYCLVSELIGRKEFQKRFPGCGHDRFRGAGRPQRRKRPVLVQSRRRARLRILGEAPARAHHRTARDRRNHRYHRGGGEGPAKARRSSPSAR